MVVIATKDGSVVYGKYGVPARATMATTELKSNDFDCVILPGGFEAPDRVRLLPEVQEFVREMDQSKKLVAAICHGPWIMISADICKGRKMTAFWSIEADIKNDTKGKPYSVVANIPYYITGMIIRTLLSHEHPPEKMALLMQKEVAQRITKRDGKESILSLAVDFYADASYEMSVKKQYFSPQPKVDSAVLSLTNIQVKNIY